MPAAILKIATSLLNLWNRTKKARQVFSLAKRSLLDRYRSEEKKDPFFPTFLMIAVCFLTIIVLLLFPGLLPGLLSATALIAL